MVVQAARGLEVSATPLGGDLTPMTGAAHETSLMRGAGAGSTPTVNVGVPDFSADWYRAVTDFAASSPGWVQGLGGFLTQALLVVFVGLFALAWWRARRRDSRTMALALLSPVVTAAAYVLSNLLKSFLQEERPCRAVARIARTVSECPEYGDWSLPSNHSVLAASAAIALLIAWRSLTVPVCLLALLEGFSRVFVGSHYPHDVLLGFALGAIVAAVLVLVGMRPMTRAVDHLRQRPTFRPVLAASPAEPAFAGAERQR